MDERTRRIGQNEALFREVNERVKDLNETFELVLDERSIVCECGNETCIEQISISPKDYEAVRADPAQFVVVPGHETPDLEEVVAERNGYAIVRKLAGVPEEIAERLDPRGSE